MALLDALKAVQIPTVEVHISHVDKREEFRQVSYVRPACVTAIWGHGFNGYLEAMDLLVGLARGISEDVTAPCTEDAVDAADATTAEEGTSCA